MFRFNLINKIFETEIMHGTRIKYKGTGTRTNKVKKNSSRTGTRTNEVKKKVQELELEP